MGSIEIFGFLPFGIIDLIDILLVAILLYKLYELIKGTMAMRIFMGVLSIYLLFLIVSALQMEMMSQIFRQFINVGVIALIVVFQQEIRKFLLAIGNSGLFRNLGNGRGWLSRMGNTSEHQKKVLVQNLCKAAFNMSESKTGALIVIEREANIQQIIDTGKALNADLNPSLIESVFFKNGPLHDGAMIIRGNKIVATCCTLPLSINRSLPGSYGMRHRAALGICEEFDAIAIVVSEETGEVSIAAEGSITPYADKLQFRNQLQQLLTGG